jgi:putative ABC transport system permease protein
LGEDPTTQMYHSVFQVYQPNMTFVVHTETAPAAALQSVRAVLLEMDRTLAVSNPQTVEQLFRSVTQRYRINANALSLFGLLALGLAALGLYGVLAYTVAQQTREIGIRMALGARQAQLRRTVIGLGIRLVVIGVAIGIPMSWWLSGAVASFLFETAPRDLFTFTVVPSILIAVAAIASYLPARRASGVNPMEALRSE